MFVSIFLFLAVVVVIAFMLQAYFKRNPKTWAKYTFIALGVLWLLSIAFSWKAYHH